MGLITGTSTPQTGTSTPYLLSLDSPDLAYIVVLLLLILGVLLIDLTRRLFIRK